MSVTLTALTDTNTFSNWKDRTNELITVAGKTVTMGDGETNAGNIKLNGDIDLETGHTIEVDNITKTSGGSLLTLGSATKITNDLTVDKGQAAAKIQIARNGSNKWAVETNLDHTEFSIVDNTTSNYLRLSGNNITTSGYKIASAALPATIANSKITATGTGASKSSFAECDVAAGIIVASKISSAGTSSNSSDFAEVDIDGGTIDGTAIGGTTASTAAFSTVSASGLITASGGVSGNLTGNVTGNTSGTAGGLTDAAIDTLLGVIYPIGSLFISTRNVNPGVARSLGGLGTWGTWKLYSEGRQLMGLSSTFPISSASRSGNIITLNFSGEYPPLEVGSECFVNGVDVVGGGSETNFSTSSSSVTITEATKDSGSNTGFQVKFYDAEAEANGTLSVDAGSYITLPYGRYTDGSGSYVDQDSQGNKTHHKLHRTEMNHIHWTGRFTGNGNDDWYAFRPAAEVASGVSNTHSDNAWLGWDYANIGNSATGAYSPTVDNLRWVAGEAGNNGNQTYAFKIGTGSNTSSTVTSDKEDMTMATGLYDDQMLKQDNKHFSIIGPHQTVAIFRRVS